MDSHNLKYICEIVTQNIIDFLCVFGERDSDIDFFFPHEIYSCYLTEEVVFETSCDFFFHFDAKSMWLDNVQRGGQQTKNYENIGLIYIFKVN